MSKLLDDLANAKQKIFINSNKIVTIMSCGEGVFKTYFKSINKKSFVVGPFGDMPMSGEMMGIKVSVSTKLPSHVALLCSAEGEILEVIVMEDLK